mgnify:CR=1 FL=1
MVSVLVGWYGWCEVFVVVVGCLLVEVVLFADWLVVDREVAAGYSRVIVGCVGGGFVVGCWLVAGCLWFACWLVAGWLLVGSWLVCGWWLVVF